MLSDIKKKWSNIFINTYTLRLTKILVVRTYIIFFSIRLNFAVFFFFFCILCVVVVVLVLPIARGRPGNWRLLTKTTMPYTAHTVCPTGISGPYVTKGIFHTGLNRLGIRNKLEIHNISILLIEARKEVGGSVVTTTRAIGWGSSCWDTQQGGQLLFNEPLEEENFTVGRMFHQSFDEIRHLQYKIEYISQQQKIFVKTHKFVILLL